MRSSTSRRMQGDYFVSSQCSLVLFVRLILGADERKALADVPNALPYHRIIETAACGYLVRQYIHSSLYDRMRYGLYI